MRLWSVLVIGALTLAAGRVARAQDVIQSSIEPDRKLFPRNWVRGYLSFDLAPLHNEPDVNRCAAWAGSDGAATAPCTAFARYVATGYVELHPIGAGLMRPLFVFWEPHLYLGSNVPQFNYTFSAAPMAYERFLGLGVELPKNFEIRLTHHRVEWLGRYEGNLGKADLGTNGPLGLYTTLGVRWYFGGWGRASQSY